MIRVVSNKVSDDKYKPYRRLAVFALLASILCLSVGYSSFSTLLKINENYDEYIASKKWLIRFDNIEKTNITGEVLVKKYPVVTSSTIRLDIELSKANDEIDYVFNVINDGDYDAILSDKPLFYGIPKMYKDAIFMNIYNEDGTEIKSGDSLNSKETKKLKLIIKYNPKDSSKLLAENELEIGTVLLYIQK